ncbi:MAG: methyltransferase domain-containing protein, partial [Flavobacteriaceae bacterium]|nr:methyltransferase domain-containing protein [Flavobacteriaceae bacterium]
MKRQGTHKPTIEDAIEISGIEMLHPGGEQLTKRTAEITSMKNGLNVLDVSSGRGTQSIFYAENYGVNVTGIDLSEEMIKTATQKATEKGLSENIKFMLGDSQKLPFPDNTFDIVVNECAVGIPDDSQKVLDEMLRVVKPGGTIAIHESTWKKKISENEKSEISERYGTTPLEFEEWKEMLQKAGAINIVSEFEEWSKPEMFWKIRKEKDVKNHKSVMSVSEKLITVLRIFKRYGLKGVLKVFQNEKKFFNA